MTRHRGHSSIFQLAPANRVLCLWVVLYVNHRFVQSEGMLCVSVANIIGTVSHLSRQSDMVSIPWEVWGQRASWVDMSGFPITNECYINGQRLVANGFEVDEETNTLKPVVVVFDFDPARLKFDTAPGDNGEPGLKLFNPEHESISSESSSEDMLDNVFFGGMCKANKLFAVRKTRINYNQIPSSSSVMVNDEHGKTFLHLSRRLF